MAAKKKTTAKKAVATKKTTAKKAVAKKTTAKKAVAKKTTAVKAVAKKAIVKKAAVAKPVAKKTTAITERYSKTQVIEELALNTELSKKQVLTVLDELASLIERHIKKRSTGEFVLPGLLKIKAVKKPAKKARKGVPNPFKPGETMDVAAKPASVAVKVQALKKLKDMAA